MFSARTVRQSNRRFVLRAKSEGSTKELDPYGDRIPQREIDAIEDLFACAGFEGLVSECSKGS